MTYTIAYALGGEPALTGWTLSSGWFASILFFLLLKRWLTWPWALATALIFQTLPAMTFGAGSGQVEARLAAFAMIAVIGFIDIADGKNTRPIILSGVGAGFFMAAKLSGVGLHKRAVPHRRSVPATARQGHTGRFAARWCA